MWKKHIFIMFHMTPCCLGGCAIFFIKSFITSAASLTSFSCFVWKKICSYCEQHVYRFKMEFYKVQSSRFLYLTINLKAKSETIKENDWKKQKKQNIFIKMGIRTPLEWIFRQTLPVALACVTPEWSGAASEWLFGCLCWAYCPAGWTYSVILTAAERLLITPVQTVVISITLPQSPDAALIMALELVLSAWLRFWTATRGFCKRPETFYEISVLGGNY